MEPTCQQPKVTYRQAHFGLWDTICVIVGIIIGAGIFRTPGPVFALSGGTVEAFAVWVAGGILAIVGAFCFAELATTYPRSGGEYIYLTRAFGSWAGFLFAWGQLLIIRTGASIVAVAYVFADYTVRLAQVDEKAPLYPILYTTLALSAILVLTITNIIGVRAGKWTQNTLTAAKVLGLGGVLVAGFLWGRSTQAREEYRVYQGQVLSTTTDTLILSTPDEPLGRQFSVVDGAKMTIDGNDKTPVGQPLQTADVKGLQTKIWVQTDQPTLAVRVRATKHSLFGAVSLALILVMWTYSGWHEGAYIAAEVRNQRRNLPRALLLGTAGVIVIYLLINAAFVVGLGYEGAADAKEVAADVLALVPGDIGVQAICILIMVSTLGGINGSIFTSSRIFSEFGADHSLFAPLGRWSPRFGTPVTALVVQAAVSVITILIVACFFYDRMQESFDIVMKGTAPVFWLFFLLTGMALFALRRLDPAIHRPFQVPLYPLTPLLYCAICGVMLYGSVAGAFEESMGGMSVALTLLAVLSGVPLYWLSRRTPRPPAVTDRDEDHKVPTTVGE